MARTTGREYGMLLHRNAKLNPETWQNMIADVNTINRGRGVKKPVSTVKRRITKKKAAVPSAASPAPPAKGEKADKF